MGLFSKERKPRRKIRPYSRRTPEQDLARSKAKRTRFLTDGFIEMANTNPKIKQMMVAKEFGLDIPEADPDEETKQQIRTFLVKSANQLIGEDDDLKREWVEQMMPEILGIKEGKFRHGKHVEGEYGGGFGSSIEDLPALLDSIDGIKERLGGGGGGFGSMLKDPEVAVAIIGLIKSVFGKGEGTQEPTYIVRINGQNRAITESQYKELEHKGMIAPVAALKEPEQAKQEPTTEPELPEFISYFDLTSMESYLSMTPEDFVEQLKYEVDSQLPHAGFLWKFLSESDYDIIVNVIKPYENHSQVGHIVQKILSEEGKTWINSVIPLIKEKK